MPTQEPIILNSMRMKRRKDTGIWSNLSRDSVGRLKNAIRGTENTK
jgi:hypothetical protein